MKKLGPLWAAMAALSVAHGADAQEDSSASARGTIEEIIVSARRKEESASTVPLTITAFGPDQLESRSITNQLDLRTSTPGLLIRATSSSNDLNYVIRGQSLEFASGSSPAVLPYFNSVQLSTGGSASLYDLESVQVLKGPQGTLFGRNTTGGAVLFSTAMPESEFGGNVTVRAGNLDQHQISGAVNVPVIEDKVLLRFAGDVSERDGYVKNLYNGKDLGDDSRDSGRVTLQFLPTDRLENTFVYQYNHSSGTNIPGQLVSSYTPGQLQPNGVPLNTNAANLYNQPALDFLGSVLGTGDWNAFLAAHPGIPNIPFSDYLAFDRANGRFKASTDESMKIGVVDHMVTNATTFDVNDDMQLKAILGYGKSYRHMINDYDGTPFPIATEFAYAPGLCPHADPDDCAGGYDLTLRQKSIEVQVTGTASSLEYMVGIYVSEDEKREISATGFFDAMPIFPQTPIVAAQDTTTTGASIFTQMSMDMGEAVGWDGVTLTAGARWAREKIEFEQLRQSVYFNVQGGENEQDNTVEEPSWVVSAEYQFTPDVMFYLAQRGSWRSGGFNGASSVPVTAYAEEGGNLFKPETTYDVEAGVKLRGDLGGMPLTASVAAYKQWVEDAQKNGYYFRDGSLAAATANVPKAEISGAEVETTILPLNWLQFGLNVSFIEARYTSNEVNLFGDIYEFGPYADAPKWSGTFFTQGDFNLDELGQLIVRADVFAQSDFVFSNLNDTRNPGTELAGYSVVNVRAQLKDIMGSTASVALYGKNVFDKGYYVGGLPEGTGWGSNAAIVAEPRTYGVELTYKF